MSDFVDPFASKRRHDGSVGEQDSVMVLRHADLQTVCKDWSTYSSDAPFRVPIPSEEDVRSVRQLPIETNPPDHTEYRSLVRGPFSRDTSMAIQSRSLALMLGRPQSEQKTGSPGGLTYSATGRQAQLEVLKALTVTSRRPSMR